MSTRHDFNEIFYEAIVEVVTELLGSSVLEALLVALEKFHGIHRDELPYRLDTVYILLEQTFGVPSAKIIGMRTVHRLYAKLSIPFTEQPDYSVVDYVNLAKKKLKGDRVNQTTFDNPSYQTSEP
ncbi:MAG: hypothetical protein ABSF09_03710 [Candidatus Bathyarchaeia archaeon]|jgi:hypothetical protein